MAKNFEFFFSNTLQSLTRKHFRMQFCEKSGSRTYDCQFYEIFENTFSINQPLVTASAVFSIKCFNVYADS